jgi:predicted naringenin-chalcone synthase
MSLVFIGSIATNVPNFAYQQSELLDFMVRFMEPISESSLFQRKLKAAFQRSAIEVRHSVLNDFVSDTSESIWNANEFPSTQFRMAQYEQHALPLALSVAEKSILFEDDAYDSITHIITISCTGMVAPGLEKQLIRELKLRNDCVSMAVNFLGCYALIPALRMAYLTAFNDPKAKILLVSVELCTLHFQKHGSDDYLLANTLFSDGACAMLIGQSLRNASFELLDFASMILPESDKLMAWHIGNHGFQMHLSGYLPSLLKMNYAAILQQIFEKWDRKYQFHRFALHPGGIKLLSHFEEETKFELLESKEVLRNYGNMSSATLGFVLNRMVDTAVAKEIVLALAMGPGITIEAMALKKV